MKRTWLAVAGVVVLLAVVLGVVSCSGAGVSGTLELSGNLNNQQEGIWVSGEGTVTAVPDVAVLSLGIEAQAVTVTAARDEAAAAMEAVMQALADQGIDENDIQTQYFSIQDVTRWDDDKNQSVTVGYRVANTVTVKVRVIDNTGSVIDAVVAAGGDLTRVNSVGFEVDDPLPYQEDARQLAVENAAAKAQDLADAAGVKLGKLSYITETAYIPGPIYRYDLMAVAEGAPAPETPISPGETEITVNVQMVYAIEY